MIEFLQTQFGFSLVLIGVVLGAIMTLVGYGILLERKIAAWVQDRVGPNRVGPQGLLQPLADGVKFFLKEDFIPGAVDKPLFLFAPFMTFVVAIVGFAAIPWAGMIDIGGPEPLKVQVADQIDVGLLYILAVGSLSAYGVILGGWASNNKFSFYGGMRAAAQMLSYEIPMGLCVLVVVLATGHLRLDAIVETQMSGTWNALLHPVAFVILIITVLAEANRMPFDLAEAEQELIGGYQTEYSGMKMALFYLGEYAHMIIGSAFIVTLFLGGWELFPFSTRLGWGWLNWLNESTSPLAAFCRFNITFGKIITFVALFMVVRWTLPRFRFDQLMRLAWSSLVPVSMGLMTWAGLLVYLGWPRSILAPVGNILVVLLALMWTRLRPATLTGRQAGLPPTGVAQRS